MTQIIELTDEDFDQFVEVMQHAAEPTPAMKEAARLHSLFIKQTQPSRAQLIQALRNLQSAADAVRTGISVHNELHADAPARRDNIEGPVITDLVNASHAARMLLEGARD